MKQSLIKGALLSRETAGGRDRSRVVASAVRRGRRSLSGTCIHGAFLGSGVKYRGESHNSDDFMRIPPYEQAITLVWRKHSFQPSSGAASSENSSTGRPTARWDVEDCTLLAIRRD
jgi:hypothetical protein